MIGRWLFLAAIFAANPAVAQDGFSVGLVGGAATNGQLHYYAGTVPYATAGAAGVVVAYDWPAGPMTFGLAADASAIGLRRVEPGSAGAVTTVTVENLATIRGRAGFVIDRVTPYLTAGLAVGTGQMHNVAPMITLDETLHKVHVGKTLGAGVEARVAEHLVVGAEYLFVDLGMGDYDSSLNSGPIPLGHDFSFWRATAKWSF